MSHYQQRLTRLTDKYIAGTISNREYGEMHTLAAVVGAEHGESADDVLDLMLCVATG